MANPSEPVLITGGGGFLGSHLAEALLRSGARVAIVDRLEPLAPWKRVNLDAVAAAGSAELFSADLTDAAALDRAVAAVRPAAVVHLAARASVRDSVERPLETARANLTGTLHVLESCRRHGVRRLVFGSSSTVYGPATPEPLREDQLDPHPASPYGVSKLIGEHYCRNWSQLHRLAVVALRLATVFGPRQRHGGAVANFVAAVEAGRPVVIFGDGSARRDFLYVSDAVAGIVAALGVELPGAPPFEVFNLGSGRTTTLNELLAAVERATGRVARREFRPAEAGDAGSGAVDIGRAEKRLGWRPRVELAAGLAEYVRGVRAAGPEK